MRGTKGHERKDDSRVGRPGAGQRCVWSEADTRVGSKYCNGGWATGGSVYGRTRCPTPMTRLPFYTTRDDLRREGGPELPGCCTGQARRSSSPYFVLRTAPVNLSSFSKCVFHQTASIDSFTKLHRSNTPRLGALRNLFGGLRRELWFITQEPEIRRSSHATG